MLRHDPAQAQTFVQMKQRTMSCGHVQSNRHFAAASGR